jgi:septum formation protein
MYQNQNPRIVLASASPRRKYLLEELGLPFIVAPSRVDESSIPYVSHREFAIKAALLKAQDVAGYYRDSLVIGADTIVCLDKEILGKPGNIEEAHDMLVQLRGRSHVVITGVAVVSTASHNIMVDAVKTVVFFKRFRNCTLESYLKSGESLDKAGAYGIQGIGECLIHHIEGDYFNVVGLPLECLFRLLSEFMDVNPYIPGMRKLRRPF